MGGYLTHGLGALHRQSIAATRPLVAAFLFFRYACRLRLCMSKDQKKWEKGGIYEFRTSSDSDGDAV